MYKIFILMLLLVSCKAKEVTRTHSEVLEVENLETVSKVSEEHKISVEDNHFQNEVTELRELLSELNISFDGQSLDDRLEVLLKQNEKSTRLTISGTGMASYSEINKQELEALQRQIFARQDSLHIIHMNLLNQLYRNIEAKLSIKDKEIKTKTFAPAVWLIIALAVILGMFLNWLLKLFRPSLMKY